jgi:hypothetical protein
MGWGRWGLGIYYKKSIVIDTCNIHELTGQYLKIEN